MLLHRLQSVVPGVVAKGCAFGSPTGAPPPPGPKCRHLQGPVAEEAVLADWSLASGVASASAGIE